MNLTRSQKQMLKKDYWITLIIANQPDLAAQVILSMGESLSDRPDLNELADAANRIIAAARSEELYRRLLLLPVDWSDLPDLTKQDISAILFVGRSKNGGEQENTVDWTDMSMWGNVVNGIGSVIGAFGNGSSGTSGGGLLGGLFGGGQQPAPVVIEEQPKWYDNPMLLVGAIGGTILVLGGLVWVIVALNNKD